MADTYRVPKFSSIMCYTDDSGTTWGIPVESGTDYTELTGNNSWKVVGEGVQKTKIFARNIKGSQYREVSVGGQLVEESPIITASLAPYISGVKEGGFYILEWFDSVKGWVVTGGQCPEEAPDFSQVDKTIKIEQHTLWDAEHRKVIAPNGKISGDIDTDIWDKYARLESCNLQETHEIYGYTGRSSKIFTEYPKVSFDSQTGKLNYENIVLSPGAAGIAIYSAVISRCNGTDRQVFTFAFRCVEINSAPTIKLDNDPIEVHSGKKLVSKRIGTASDEHNDEMTVYSQVISGRDLLIDPEITIENNKLILNAEARNGVVGTALIEFKVDDGHGYKCTSGSYDRHIVPVNVVNHLPKVTMPDTTFRLNIKNGQTQTINVGTIQDEDGDDEFRLGDVYIDNPESAIDNMSLEIDGSTLTAEITLSNVSAGPAVVFFKVHDQHGVYSDMNEQQYKSFYVISENTPPKVNISQFKLDIRGLDEQVFTIGTISDADGDNEFTAKITKVEGPKCYDSMSLAAEGSNLKLTIRPSRRVSGSMYVYFKVDDKRMHYTNGEPVEYYINVCCGNTPPVFNQTVDHIVVRNGETITKVIGTISDPDGDEEFFPVMLLKDESEDDETGKTYADVISGQMFVDGNNVKVTIVGREGCIGEERIKFMFDDARGNYTHGEQEEYELIVRVI